MNRFTIIVHRLLYPLLVSIFRSMRKHEFIFLNESPEIKENVIFAVNHSNKYDIPYTCEAIKRQSYVLIGKQPLEPIDRLAFHLYGTVWVDRKDSQDKKRATADMIKLLRMGANLVMFPEGTWNLTPSKPMIPLYWGVIDISRNTQNPIVPIILEYTDKKCYVALGEPMYISHNDDKGENSRHLNGGYGRIIPIRAAIQLRNGERKLRSVSRNIQNLTMNMSALLSEKKSLISKII